MSEATPIQEPETPKYSPVITDNFEVSGADMGRTKNTRMAVEMAEIEYGYRDKPLANEQKTELIDTAHKVLIAEEVLNKSRPNMRAANFIVNGQLGRRESVTPEDIGPIRILSGHIKKATNAVNDYDRLQAEASKKNTGTQ